MEILRWSAGVLLLALMHISFATTNSVLSVIEGSYLVTFKDPVGNEKPFIAPPDYSLKDQPGFVPTPMGYLDPVKAAAIEKALNLNGKVKHIFETINAVHILMDAKEADRLSQDKRVKFVEQDSMLGIAGSGQDADDLFSFNMLNLPYWFQSEKPWGKIINSQAEWEALYAEMLTAYNKVLTDQQIAPPMAKPAPSIDFINYQLVIGGLGARASGGHLLSIDRVVELTDGLYIDVSEIISSHCGTFQAITYPTAAILVKKTNKPIKISVSKPAIREC